MNRVGAGIVSGLLGLLLAGTAFAAGDSRSCSCADLAFTDTFRLNRVDYVATEEFARAVHAVATGASKFSPREIPSAWKEAAAGWMTPVAAASEGPFGPDPAFDVRTISDKDISLDWRGPCSTALLYLASREYRARPGHEEAVGIYPYVVQAAARELGERVAAKQQMASGYENRVALIGARIAEAERLGAGDCLPKEVLAAKLSLERARGVALGLRWSVADAEAAMSGAQQAADILESYRQYAARHGIRCYKE
jgi:hypothetical protein